MGSAELSRRWLSTPAESGSEDARAAALSSRAVRICGVLVKRDLRHSHTTTWLLPSLRRVRGEVDHEHTFSTTISTGLGQRRIVSVHPTRDLVRVMKKRAPRRVMLVADSVALICQPHK